MLDLSTPANLLASLESFSYFIIFLIFIIEGPVVNYAAAFAASLGFFNVFIIFSLAVLGNVVGDLIPFLIGKLGKKSSIEKYISKSMDKRRIAKIKKYLKHNPGKTLTVIKITPLIPTPGLILAGIVDMPVKRFIFYSFVISASYAFFLTVLGYYSGAAFVKIFGYFKYGTYLAGALAITFVALWLFLSQKISNKIEKI